MLVTFHIYVYWALPWRQFIQEMHEYIYEKHWNKWQLFVLFGH